MPRIAVVLAVSILLTGCTVGKKYQRPAVEIPDVHRAAPATPAPSSVSLADAKWFEVFKDEKLQQLVRESLVSNFDARVAVARIDLARGQLGITRADQFPNVNAGADLSTVRTSRSGEIEAPKPAQVERTFGTVALSLLTFELDIWGRLRRATEAQRAQLLSEEENQRAIFVTLVAAVAQAYFELRELDLELDISRRTLSSREESLRLIKLQESAGIATMLEVRQAEELVFTAAARIPELEGRIVLQENFIATLLGVNPRDIPRGEALVDQHMPPEIPSGLTSDLIDRRPDIRAAEQQLVSANALVGVAKAAYFPRISLTGFFGFQSDQLSSLFSGPTRIWAFTPQLAQPIFQAGRLKSNVRVAKAQREIALIEYERAIQNGFREVSDALISYQKVREQRAQQDLLVGALRDRVRLSMLRYEGGIDNYLNVLDAERELFNAELDLAQLRLGELTTVVQLYKALGGGWEQ